MKKKQKKNNNNSLNEMKLNQDFSFFFLCSFYQSYKLT